MAGRHHGGHRRNMHGTPGYEARVQRMTARGMNPDGTKRRT